jgi:hypothetical protein
MAQALPNRETPSSATGVHEEEYHPQMPLWTCSSSGCIKQMKSVALDANWRWLHNGQYTNCHLDHGGTTAGHGGTDFSKRDSILSTMKLMEDLT